jgi:CRP/FNR family transcriptional regulator
MTPSASCAACPVRDTAVCAGLPADERDALARLGRRRRFAAGETIFAAGDASVACASLIAGAVKLTRSDADGVERTVGLIHPAGFLARLFAATEDDTVIALVDSEVCLFPRSAVERDMRAFPGFMERVLRATVDQLDQSRALVELIGRRDTRSRLAGFLRLVSDGRCAAHAVIDLQVSRGDIAALLGTTIETVSRQFAALEDAGLVRRHGLRGVEILDPAGLAALAG